MDSGDWRRLLVRHEHLLSTYYAFFYVACFWITLRHCLGNTLQCSVTEMGETWEVARLHQTSGAKALFFCILCGTAEAVP